MRASTEGSYIYREAAQRLERGLACSMGCLKSCCAIRMVEGYEPSIRIRYAKLFEHHYTSENGWWDSPDDAHTDTRILALCLMAAMVEAGDA